MNNKMNDKILLAMQMVYCIVETSDRRNVTSPNVLNTIKLLLKERNEYEETGDTSVLETYKVCFKQLEEILANAMEEVTKNDN